MRKNYSKKYVLLCAFIFMSVMAFAQTGGIKGKVVDESNQPMPGVAVSIDGTTIGSTTDVSGNYTITHVNAGKYTVSAKFIGYATSKQQITVGSSVIDLNFDLKPENTALNEVVVIGYGTQKSKDVTGSIATVTAKDFNTGTVTSPEQLIQGKVAGVSIISNSGAPGAGSTIRIRGGASVNGSNDPLIVIDGVPLSNTGIAGAANPLDLINPNDIASFSILKDASAAAIYGNRASNGVILITTKKGQTGKPQINFTTQFSVGTLPKEAPVLSPAQFRAYVIANDTTAGSAGNFTKLLGSASTDWQKQIYQTSYSTDNNLSLSGATANNKLPYRVSVGYTDQNGILKTTSLERYTASVNLSPSLFTDHLKINFNFKGSQVKQRFTNEGNVIGAAVAFDPTQPVYSGKSIYGGYFEYLDPSSNTGLKGLAPLNPLGLLNENKNTSDVYRTITSLNLDYKFHFFPDLHAVINLSYDGSVGKGNDVIPGYAASNLDSYKDGNGNFHSGNTSQYKQVNANRLAEGYLSYSKDIKVIKSHVDVVAGYSFQDFQNTNLNFLSYFSDGTVNPGSVSNYPYDIQESQLTSVYGRLVYTFDSKYYLTGTMRSDVSTRFAPGIRTGNFPSAALGWRLNEEEFLKGSKVISNLKLRAEYGVTGNQDGIGNYDYLSPFSLSSVGAQYQFGNTYYQAYRPAAYYPNRTWEQTATTNFGFDYGFFNERLTGSVDYYYRKTKNLLATISEPAGSNFSNQIVGNVGNMEDHGLEFSVNAKIIEAKDLSWSVGFNATINRNKIQNLSAIFNPTFSGLHVGGISGGLGNTIQIDQPGYAKNSFNTYQQVYGANGKPLDGVFVDRNGDGIINELDLYTGKSPDPQEYFGINSDVRVKKWSA